MRPPVLLHFSEDPAIEVFHPRIATLRDTSEEPFVWAVDAEHAPLYWFPRDCPRIACWRNARTTDADAERFLGVTGAHRVHAIEWSWLPRVSVAALHVYRFDPAGFELHEDDAETGHWVSREPVRPVGRETIVDLLAAHAVAGIELRVMSSLWPLADALIASTMRFSMSRMRNAGPRPSGTGPAPHAAHAGAMTTERSTDVAELDEKERKELDRKDFAYVDKEGGEHLPIHDEAHVRNAISRFNQTNFDSATAKEGARKKILAAAKKHGIDVSPDDHIAKASDS